MRRAIVLNVRTAGLLVGVLLPSDGVRWVFLAE